MIPNWYHDALARMKTSRRHGIVLVVSDDEEERTLLANGWLALLQAHDPEVIETLAEGVFINVTPAIAKDAVRRKNEPANRFLVNPDGKVLAADVCNLVPYLAADRFVRHSRKLLRGTGDSRLKAEAEAIRASLTDDLKALLDAGVEAPLHDHAEQLVTLLVWMKLQGTAWVAPLIHNAGLFRAGRVAAPGGMELHGQWTDPCPPCGMAAPGPEARRFLTFLTGPSKEPTDGSFWQQTI